MPDDFGTWRAAGFPGDDRAQLRSFKTLRQPLDMRGFSRPLSPLECDEAAPPGNPSDHLLGHVSPELLNALQRVTIGDLKPDLTFVLDVPVEVGLNRATVRRGNRAPDRFESEDVRFHQELREGYREIAAAEPDRCVLIDATADVDTVAAQIWAVLRARLSAAASRSVASPA